ncbi:restriction endonuclease subunit S [Mesorhizobium sp. B2-1-8]|uniref:restriction endonuclease subunit S n=1 Tax=Mesorhizobium sp. B2-1-8 TaxID=2589967 RepID=UPI001129A7CF|nr:restriction endonuclease subunit S [Mesorhizobium sp. B2-1-8]UCI21815.1 restriction endonuclease subunit S [Mesorhizobium sp. B2-1-8]
MNELPAGWARARLGDIGVLHTGQSPSADTVNQEGRGTSYVTGPEQWDGSAFHKPKWTTDPKRVVPEGCIFITVKGAGVGKTFPGIPAAIGRDIYAYQPSAELDFQFILRTIAYRAEEIIENAHGDIPGLSKHHIEGYSAAIPPVSEQRRIVARLDELSSRVDLSRSELQKISPLVEYYKLNLLRSAFRGELTAGFRKQQVLEPVEQLLARIDEPEQTRGGRHATNEIIEGRGGISINNPGTVLPTGWDWVPLLRVARQETGHTPSRSHPEWWGGDVPWIGIPDANRHHGSTIDDTIQKINDTGLSNSSARLLPAGTVILSRTASVGYVAIMGREMATSQDFATWSCTDAVDPKYLMYALLSEGDDIRNFGRGTTHTTIYFPEIRAFNIKLAPLEEQREIVRQIEDAFSRVSHLAREVERSLWLVGRAEQRILAKAFTGQLVEQDVGEEPADKMLDRIRETSTISVMEVRPKRPRAKTVKTDPKQVLLTDSANWPEKGLAFEAIVQRVVLPYGAVRDALFELLSGKAPELVQVFDKDEGRMLLKRVAR